MCVAVNENKKFQMFFLGTIESKVVAEKRQDVQSSYSIHTLDGFETLLLFRLEIALKIKIRLNWWLFLIHILKTHFKSVFILICTKTRGEIKADFWNVHFGSHKNPRYPPWFNFPSNWKRCSWFDDTPFSTLFGTNLHNPLTQMSCTEHSSVVWKRRDSQNIHPPPGTYSWSYSQLYPDHRVISQHEGGYLTGFPRQHLQDFF